MIFRQLLSEDDAVYGLKVKQSNGETVFDFVLVCDCKKKKHINDHGAQYHYSVLIAESDDKEELEICKDAMDSYRNAG